VSKKLQHKQFEPEQEQSRLNKILALQKENDVISLLLEGKEQEEIIKYVINKYRIQHNTAKSFISHCRAIIRGRKDFEVNNLVSLHVERYEKIYAGLYEIKAYGIAMSALRAKEKLLGFHKEGFHMRVSKGEISTVQLQTVNSEYDVMKLNKEKRDRLSELLQKAKKEKKLSQSKEEKQIGEKPKKKRGRPKKNG